MRRSAAVGAARNPAPSEESSFRLLLHLANPAACHAERRLCAKDLNPWVLPLFATFYPFPVLSDIFAQRAFFPFIVPRTGCGRYPRPLR